MMWGGLTDNAFIREHTGGFDAKTFKEIKRIPMDKPVGKYNLHNKITKSEGTSH